MPDILPPATLSILRGIVRDLAMPGTAHVLRGTVTPDGIGGWTNTYGTVSISGTVSMPCRYRPSSAQERERSGKLVAEMSWTVVFPAEWAIAVADRIVIDGRTFMVEGMLAPKTWEMERHILCTEVT